MAFTVTGNTIGVTVGDFCDRILEEHLERGERRELDQLNGAVLAGADTITTRHNATGLKPQARIEIDDELLHVWSHDSGTQVTTVARGHGGSTAAAHADNALVRINPRFPRTVLADTLRREVRSWPSSVYAPVSGDFSVVATTETLDLDGLLDHQVVRVCRVQRRHPDTTNTSWPTMPGYLEYRQGADFASGWGLRFPYGFGAATDVRITVGLAFAVPEVIDFSADLGTEWLLSPGLVDAAMFGVASLLLASEEVARSDQWNQARPRKGEDVPPGYGLQLGQALRTQRNELLKAEAERLYAQYPPERG